MPGMDGFINFNGTLEGSIAGGDSGAVKDVKTNASGSYQSVVDDAGNAMIDLSVYANETDVSEDIQSLSGQLANKQNIVNYSTDEQNTGIKWLDGKYIYVKTVNFDLTDAPVTHFNMDFIDTFIYAQSVLLAKTNENYILPLSYYESNNFFASLQFDNLNKTLDVICTQSVVTNYKFRSLVFYTKTEV